MAPLTYVGHAPMPENEQIDMLSGSVFDLPLSGHKNSQIYESSGEDTVRNKDISQDKLPEETHLIRSKKPKKKNTEGSGVLNLSHHTNSSNVGQRTDSSWIPQGLQV